MLKTLTLLILTAIVMASVACGPSKTTMLCEDALERRAQVQSHIYDIRLAVTAPQGQFLIDENGELALAIGKQDMLTVLKDIDEYCK